MTTAPQGLFEANRRLNEEEIARGCAVLESRPRNLMAILTTRCSLSCIMCTREVSNKLLREEAALKLAELFPYLETANWQGGEAFAAPYLDKLVALASEHEQLTQFITTSGIPITKDWARLLARARVRLNISIDGISPETYERIRQGASFGRLLRNLDFLNEAYSQRGLHEHLELHATIMRSNHREIDFFPDFAKSHGFSRISFRPVLYISDSENIFQSQDHEALAYLAQAAPRLRGRARELGLGFYWGIPAAQTPDMGEASGSAAAPALPSGLLCKKPWKMLHINCISRGGDAYPECFCPGDRPVGNLLTDSIMGIWNSPMMQEYRRRLASGSSRGFCSDVCVSGQVAPDLLA